MRVKSKQAVPSAKPFVVVLTGDGRATLRERGDDPTTPWHSMPELASGQDAAVFAAARLLASDAWEIATCTTPTGRLDCHFMYLTRVDGEMVCMFCRQPMVAP